MRILDFTRSCKALFFKVHHYNLKRVENDGNIERGLVQNNNFGRKKINNNLPKI